MSRRAAILFVALGIAWGIPYLLIKVSMEELTPAFLVLARTTIASLVLLPFALRSKALAPALRHWRPVALYAAVEVAVPWLLLGSAEQRLPSSTSGLIVAAVPIAAVAIAFATGRGERLGIAGWIGLLVGLVGVASLVGLDVQASDRGAVLMLLVVVFGYAVGPMVLARWLADVPAVGVMTLVFVMAAVVYVPIVAFGPGLPSAVPSAGVIAAVLVLAVVCTAISFVLLFDLVALIGPVRVAAITYVNPAVAVLGGALFLGEAVTQWTFLGFGLVLLGSFLITRRPSETGGLVDATGFAVLAIDDSVAAAFEDDGIAGFAGGADLPAGGPLRVRAGQLSAGVPAAIRGGRRGPVLPVARRGGRRGPMLPVARRGLQPARRRLPRRLRRSA